MLEAIRIAGRAESRSKQKSDAAMAAQAKRIFQLDVSAEGDQDNLGFVQSEKREHTMSVGLTGFRRVSDDQEYQGNQRRRQKSRI